MMVRRNIIVILISIFVSLLSGCVELGSLVVHYFKITDPIKLTDLDGSYLSSETWGTSDMCLNRRSSVGMQQYMGICLDNDRGMLVIYRVFENKFNIKEKGISQEMLNSVEYQEFSNLVSVVEEKLKSKNIKFEKQTLHYQEFSGFSKQFNFYR